MRRTRRIAEGFLRWYCNPDFYPDIRGDLEEIWQKRLTCMSQDRADLLFCLDILKLLRISLIRPMRVTKKFSRALFLNHVNIATRKMSKEKLYSAIKVGGFSLGVACCLLLLIYLRQQLSFDQHYQRGEDIYRLNMDYVSDNIIGVDFPAPIIDALRNDFPTVEAAGRMSMPVFLRGTRNIIRSAEDQENYFEDGICFVDPEILEILEVPMIYGDRQDALSKPHTVVISKSIADKHFPGINPIGKQMVVNDEVDNTHTVGGVMEDFPATSHLTHLHILYSLTEVEFWSGERTDWCCNNHWNYVRLRPGTDVDAINQDLQSILNTYYLPSYYAKGDANPESIVNQMEISLQPIADIYLDADVLDKLAHGDRRLLWIFATAAILILLLACVNFINLATARSATRGTEVGIRRCVGGTRSEMIRQFMVESIVFTLFSFAIGVLLARMLLPFFVQMIGVPLEIPWMEFWFLPSILIVSLVIGLFAGLYPAFYLSSFKPLEALRGGGSKVRRNPLFRNGLVIFQFASTIILLIGTGIVFKQFNYILDKEIGFVKNQVIMIQGTNILGDQIDAFKEELSQLPEVSSVSVSDFLPIAGTKRSGTGFNRKGMVGVEPSVTGQWWTVDHDYVQTMGMKIKHGRDFSRDMSSDSQAVLISESMVAELGLEDPIDKQIEFSGGKWRVVGIVENFHFESLRQKVSPVALVLGNSPSIVSVRAPVEDLNKVLEEVKVRWKSFMPFQPLRYQYMDESFARIYDDVLRSARVFFGFATCAILIACLGLFGLTAYIAEQRSKEIGIRKVLGASSGNILGLISKEFSKLILISLLVGAPLAWFFMRRWLEGFAYRVDIGLGIYIASGSIALLVALVTMSYHSIRSARANPVDVIR